MDTTVATTPHLLHRSVRLRVRPPEGVRSSMDAPQLIDAVRRIKDDGGSPEQQVQRLRRALRAFVGNAANRHTLNFHPVSRGLYTRLLLSSFADDFQIVVVLWGPGSCSPIHDHHDTAGAVAALSGSTRETKHHMAAQPGACVRLREGETITLCENTVTPILPDEDTQLHAMANTSDEWAATVHVYLTPVMDFHLYEPLADGRYRRLIRKLWFDGEDAWRH